MVALYAAVPNIKLANWNHLAVSWICDSYSIFGSIWDLRKSKRSCKQNEYDYEANYGYIEPKDSKSQVYLYMPGIHHLMSIVKIF